MNQTDVKTLGMEDPQKDKTTHLKALLKAAFFASECLEVGLRDCSP